MKVYADANDDGAIDDGDTVVGYEQLGPGQTSYSITVPLVPNAANHFLVSATDAAGNPSPARVVPTITQDSIAPAAPAVTSPAAPLAINAGSIAVAGTAEAGSLVTIYRDYNHDGSIEVGDVVVGSEQLAAGQTAFSIAVPLDQNTPNSFVATATDAGGNASAPAVVPTITADSVAPHVPTVTGPSGPITVNTPTAAVSGAAEANSLVRVYVDLNDNGSIDPGDLVIASEQLTGGASAYSIPAPLSPNGANHLLVTATDAAGNQSAPVGVPTITQDSIAPAVPVGNGPTGPVSVDATTRTFTGTAEAGSLVQVYDDANHDGKIDAGDTVAGYEQLGPGQTSYSITVALAPNAPNNFLITATDAAGNRSTPIVVPTITQDSIAPAAPTVGSPSGPMILNASTTTLTGTAEAGSLRSSLRRYQRRRHGRRRRAGRRLRATRAGADLL